MEIDTVEPIRNQFFFVRFFFNDVHLHPHVPIKNSDFP